MWPSVIVCINVSAPFKPFPYIEATRKLQAENNWQIVYLYTPHLEMFFFLSPHICPQSNCNCIGQVLTVAFKYMKPYMRHIWKNTWRLAEVTTQSSVGAKLMSSFFPNLSNGNDCSCPEWNQVNWQDTTVTLITALFLPIQVLLLTKTNSTRPPCVQNRICNL